MKINRLIFKIMLVTVLFFLMPVTHAGTPLWTFKALTPTTVLVPVNSSATIQYSVTNQSKKTHTLVMTPIIGISQITTAGNCPNPFTLSYQQSCTLTLSITGSKLQGKVIGGPEVCQNGSPLQCYQPCGNSLNITPIPRVSTTLSASVGTLALKTSGKARIITITNTGTNPAFNVRYSFSPALPAGTSITPASCGMIVPAGTCILTITPGGTPSAAPGDTNPKPITFTIAGDNTNKLAPTINVLAYGSVYQSGYVFSFDDTTPNTGSVGGKVAALTDQAAPFPNGIIWSSDGSGNLVYNDIPGIYENSTNPPDSCNGNIDGVCNTGVIVAFYPGINLSFYAAGLCKAPNAGYTDWYLPAICELGYGTFLTNCGTALAPTIQNMQSNLVDNGDIGSLSGKFYWSSTENSNFALVQSWYQDFETNGGSSQFVDDKGRPFAVRCVRALRTHP